MKVHVQILFSRLNDNDGLNISLILFTFQIVAQTSSASVVLVKVIVFLFTISSWQTIEHGLLIPSHGTPLL